jgi:hypothetical protein
VYYRYRAVSDAGDHVWNRFAPFILGALLALTLALILVAWLLAAVMRRRLSRSMIEPAAEPGSLLDEQVVEPDPGTQLVDALSLLVARTNGGGLATTLDTDDVRGSLPPAIAMLLYRATRDALRSLPAHKHATPVTVRVSDRDHFATLDIVDGGGKRKIAAHNGANGHGGWRALTDLVADAGGRLLVEAADNGATHVHVEVPLP